MGIENVNPRSETGLTIESLDRFSRHMDFLKPMFVPLIHIQNVKDWGEAQHGNSPNPRIIRSTARAGKMLGKVRKLRIQ